MHCTICGDEEQLSRPIRFWSPDDGWTIGRFCQADKSLVKRRPKPADYAYDQRGEYVADVDQAIDVLFG